MKHLVFLAAADAAQRDALWHCLARQPPAERHVVTRVDGPGQPAWDAVLELWSQPSPDALMQALVPGGRLVACAVDELIEKDTPGAWRSQAIKLVVPWTRRVDVSPQEARRHWDEHVPLANRVHIGCARYVRHWVRAVDARGVPVPAWQGVAMQHFPTAADFEQRMFDSAESKAAVHADVADFIGGFDTLIGRELE